MMLFSVKAGSDDRVRQTSLLLQQIKKLEETKDHSIEELIKINKGMIFVSLYSSIEFTILNAVSEFLSSIKNDAKKPLDYKQYLLPIILGARFDALSGAGKKSLWPNRAELIDAIFSESAVEINNAVCPTDTINIAYEQIVGIWKYLHLPKPILPEGLMPFHLAEIKAHRNAIAHGREKAASIGGRFTLETLEARHKSIELFCAHIVVSFQEHLKNKGYLLTAS